MGPQYDLGLQDAARMFGRFRGEGGTPGTGPGSRPMKWGDKVNQRNQQNNNIEACFVDVGPFPEPVLLKLDQHIDILNPNFFFGPIQPQWIYRFVWSVGDAANMAEFPILPRNIRARSLQVYARRRTSAVLNEPDVPMSIWATMSESTQGLPIPFDYVIVSMGIGTATINLPAPPRIATHIMAATGPGENNKLLLSGRVLNSAATFNFPLSFPGGAGTTPAIPYPVPIPHDAETYQLRRDITTGAVDYTVWWCR